MSPLLKLTTCCESILEGIFSGKCAVHVFAGDEATTHYSTMTVCTTTRRQYYLLFRDFKSAIETQKSGVAETQKYTGIAYSEEYLFLRDFINSFVDVLVFQATRNFIVSYRVLLQLLTLQFLKRVAFFVHSSASGLIPQLL